MKKGMKLHFTFITFALILAGIISGINFYQYRLLEEITSPFDLFSPTTPGISDGEDYYGMIMSTFLGGTNYDYCYAIAIDENTGAIYVAGYTTSSNFPRLNAYDSTLSSSYDAFVTKYNGDGSLNFSTYLGGSSSDYARDIAIDANGDCYVTGYTYSTNFPVLHEFDSTINGDCDVFITKFNSNGTLNFSTYFGGTSDDEAYGIAVHSDGSYYITGHTFSSNFPVLNAFDSTYNLGCDIFITKFNSNGTLNFSTYFGGSGYDQGNDICVDNAQNIYIAAQTGSNSLSTLDAADKYYGGGEDGLVGRFDKDGFLNYSTYIGSSSLDQCTGIDVDNTGAFYATGTSYTSYETGQDQIIAVKYNPDGSLNYSKYFGGTAYDSGTALDVDNEGNCFLTGYTDSDDFPTVLAADDDKNAVNYYAEDTFICQLDSSGDIVFSSYIGGAAYDYGYDIAVDAKSTIYITGYTSSSNFPTVNAIDSYLSGYNDAFVMKLFSPMGDYDSDGLPNYWEHEMMLDMRNATDAALDFDNDLLNNTEEFLYGTHALDNDTDSDELLDGEEIKVYFTDPVDPDTDGDSMHDGWELQMGLNATDSSDRTEDKDLDDLPNYWEFSMHLNASFAGDRDLDGDLDNLTNYEEFQVGSSAINPDTDYDLLNDWEELYIYETNLIQNDTDSDGAGDGLEVLLYNTDPLDWDTDGDNMPDGYEIDCYLEPLDSSDANLDKDNDGLPNLYEYHLGLNANDEEDANTDLDGDGIPTIWEYEHGLDPEYDFDAIFDPDDDGLSNLDEYHKGTDPYNPDTDGDGINDRKDGHPTSFMRPTGGLITFFSFIAVFILSIVFISNVKRVRQKKIEFQKTYFFCPKCSMKNLRAKGICTYCGEELDPSKIDSMVKQEEKKYEKA